MRRQLPPLNALRAFDAAASTGNFTEAGRALNVSQGAISRHIAQLEEFLGIRLFERHARRVRLTPEGMEYALLIRGAFDRIEEATRTRIALPRRRPLRLKLFPTVAMKWLVSRLGRFHALHPSVDVQIMTTASLVSLDADDVDFTIQSTPPSQEGVMYERLFEITLVAVCSPAYAAAIPAQDSAQDSAPGGPAALLGCTLLHSMKRPDDWRTWFRAAGLGLEALHEGLAFGNSSLAYQAAIEGAGIAIAHTAFVDEDIAAGRLVVCHPLRVPTGEHYHLVGRRSHESRDAATFRAWLIAEARTGCAHPGP